MRPIPFRKSIVAMVMLMSCFGCQSQAEEASTLKTTRIEIATKTYEVEIANTEAARRKGLMQRDSMPQDHGMIFVFAEEQDLQFWMKNTRFPLDIIFLDAGGKVISIKSMKPYDLNTTDSDGPAKYAIELNKGQAAACKIEVGAKVHIPPEAADAKE
jgi:uncharacterized protein